MGNMKLSEACEKAGITRRILQGYEEAGLIQAKGKNKRGYLLYDNKSIERMQKIRFYQEIGFSIKEIITIIDAPNDVLKIALINRVKIMEERSEKLGALIIKAKKVIKQL